MTLQARASKQTGEMGCADSYSHQPCALFDRLMLLQPCERALKAVLACFKVDVSNGFQR